MTNTSFAQITNVSISFGDRDLLKDINLTVTSRKRTALTGDNGSGKSTLMKIIAGLEKADSGKITIQKNCRVSYLPQDGIIHQGCLLKKEVEKAFNRQKHFVNEKEKLEIELSKTNKESFKIKSMIEEHHKLQEEIINSGYYSREEEISRILTGLGFTKNDFSKSTEEFSGGWQMRIALSKILLEKPDILLLDEPTNYLDIEARNWLEGFLINFMGALLVVSHDRYFLDATVSETAEIFNGELKVYKGNYSEYEIKRKKELEDLLKGYKNQQEEIDKTEDFINRFRYNAAKARLVQSRIKYLEKIELIKIPESMKTVSISFPPAPHSGKQVLQLNGINKSYGTKQVIKDLSFELRKGERLALTGKNGSGKSTLLRIISGISSDFSGTVKYGKGIEVGYFSQDNFDKPDPLKTVFQNIEKASPGFTLFQLRNLLAAFLFRGNDVYKKTEVLSGGELNRLALLTLLLHPANLLLLDEPTNHLDINSKNVLLNALKKYSGTLIFVSHDRCFLDSLATKILELTETDYSFFHGNYSYYLWKTGQNRENNIESNIKTGQNAANGKLKREEEKKHKSILRRLEREETNLLEQVEKLEKEHTVLTDSLSLPEIYSDITKATKVQKEIKHNKEKQRELSFKWGKVAGELQEIKQ